MSTVNMRALLNTLEKFYLSNLNQQTIRVDLYEPFNDYIYLVAIRSYNYSNTVFTFLTQLNLYLSVQGFVTEVGNKSNNISINGINTLNSSINTVYNKHYTKYLTTYTLNDGNINYNPNPT
jgi:hypothetical protein